MVRIFLVGAIISSLSCMSALAFCKDPPARLCQILFHHDLVVYGEVIKKEILKDADDPEGIAGWLYSINVLKAYRGTPEKTVIVRSENASDRLVLEPGRKYIVFAKKLGDGATMPGTIAGRFKMLMDNPIRPSWRLKFWIC